jgi:DTW domain-containing protein YfiP
MIIYGEANFLRDRRLSNVREEGRSESLNLYSQLGFKNRRDRKSIKNERAPLGVDPSTSPISLLQLLQDTELSKPSITDRVDLAKVLANCIMYLRSANWPHKRLTPRR